ncbi:MAG: DNA gyrase subunit B, partial [Deltaproteobacteria bacterium]|nr:DNA gyrase subunit B [Deltaproteobacteria bacterium]
FKAKGEEISGKELSKLTKKLIRYKKVLDLIQQKKDPRIVDAVVEVLSGPAVLKGGKKLDLELDKIAQYIKKHYPDLRDFELEVEQDTEHDASRAVYQTTCNNSPKKTVVDLDFLNSAEFIELKKMAEEFEKLGEGPYQLNLGEEKLPLEELDKVRESILAHGQKGQDIQRYKGLGEMNPHQLWDTTMNPATRTLLQVKVEDAVEADQIFTVLMGDEVDPRRQFIEENALAVKNLDI